jgi:hypothetical protein
MFRIVLLHKLIRILPIDQGSSFRYYYFAFFYLVYRLNFIKLSGASITFGFKFFHHYYEIPCYFLCKKEKVDKHTNTYHQHEKIPDTDHELRVCYPKGIE